METKSSMPATLQTANCVLTRMNAMFRFLDPLPR